jgi:WD40 repeat protein
MIIKICLLALPTLSIPSSNIGSSINCLIVLKDGSLATGSEKIKLWNTMNGNLIKEFWTGTGKSTHGTIKIE